LILIPNESVLGPVWLSVQSI